MTITLDHPTLLFPDVVDDVTRRRFMIGSASAALLAAGCGTGGTDAPRAVETRTADTPRGPVTVPVDPQRVYAAYTHDVYNALVLGLPVVAGPGEYGAPGATVPSYILDQFPQAVDIELVPYRPDLNYERIAALRPDVILSSIFGSDDTGYERLDAIAPTVTSYYSTGENYAVAPWRDVLRQNATQFARDGAAERFITAFEERAAQLRERIAARWAGATWAYLEPYTESLFVGGPAAGHVAATLTDEIGLAIAPSVERLLAEAPVGNQGGTAVSYERLGAIEADLIFVAEYFAPDGDPADGGRALLEAQPLWASLPTVSAGRVYAFTQSMTEQSGPTATAFLDVVERALLA